ncbi:MAG TPA: NAD(P)-dependent oxidoreductase [Candidatus Microsaccharimonas sp.]|nr:NAD(P)-dependent oxidoreductase [Candidatus Microsaccharimonas sp.]
MNDSEILIVGSNGQLGLALQAKYPGARAADSAELDITSEEAVQGFNWTGIKYILNAAAYTNVDGAETLEGRVAAWQVNAVGPRNLAAVATKHDLTLLHISTDYVFDGMQSSHREDEPFSPLGVYGQSKAAGDISVSLAPKHYILRTSWVIGEGKNFVRTMIGLGQKGIAPTVVADQVGRLTFTSELVRAIDHLLSSLSPYGTYNVSNSGDAASWADITREIFTLGHFDLTVTDTRTEEYFASKPEAAPRPLLSTLDLSKIESTKFEPRDWLDDLKDYVEKELA